jgi:hypothetical protein
MLLNINNLKMMPTTGWYFKVLISCQEMPPTLEMYSEHLNTWHPVFKWFKMVQKSNGLVIGKNLNSRFWLVINGQQNEYLEVDHFIFKDDVSFYVK